MADKDGILEFEGIVDNVVRDKVFVTTDSGIKVLCTLSGKIRQSGIKILPNDRVQIAVSVYDTTKGRIVYRIK